MASKYSNSHTPHDTFKPTSNQYGISSDFSDNKTQLFENNNDESIKY